MTQWHPDVEALKGMITRKLELFNEFYDITIKQTLLIREGKFEKLHSSLERRQLLIEEIDQLDQEINQLREALSHANSDLPGLEGLTRELVELESRIYEIDVQNQNALTDSFQQMKTEMKRLRNGRKAAVHYQSPSPQGRGFFVDKKN